jgi:hypothetical protein
LVSPRWNAVSRKRTVIAVGENDQVTRKLSKSKHPGVTDLIKDLVRQYWLNMLAIAMFVAALLRYVRLGGWEEHLVPFASAVFGLVCVIASEEVAEWTGGYGWTRQQWRQYPSAFVRFAGGVALVVATVVLYLR